MKITEPEYYKEFQCTADACSYHCCQQWRIGVEEEVVDRWKSTSMPEGMKTDGNVLADCLNEEQDGFCICHRENGVCPFIDEVGLCNVIKTYSDQMTPQACQQFPREFHRFEDAEERSLSPGCPVALDLLLNQETFRLSRYECDDSADQTYATSGGSDHNTYAQRVVMKDCDSEVHRELLEVLRNWYLDIVQESDCDVDIALRILFYLSVQVYDKENELDCDFDVAMLKELQRKMDIKELIAQMECLKEEREMREVYQERKELFFDIVGNYYQQEMYVEFLQPLMEVVERWNVDAENMDCEIYFEKWMKLLVCQELSGVVVANQQQTMYDVIIKLQWLVLEYATLQHWMCLLQARGELEPPKAQEAIVILSRIMGYTEEDIFEYMEEAFEEAIWPFGYLNLIV